MDTTTYTDADGCYPTNEDWAALHASDPLSFNAVKVAVTEITTEIEAEFLAEGIHIIHSNTLANGMTKGFTVKAIDAVAGSYPDRLHLIVLSSWGAKHVAAIKSRLGAKLQARFPGHLFCHRKSRGFKIWFTYFSDGNVDGWAAGIDYKGAK
jgi:hypothetical protein